jgi:hypothetical protein
LFVASVNSDGTFNFGNTGAHQSFTRSCCIT